jgi:hypothetical protein
MSVLRASTGLGVATILGTLLLAPPARAQGGCEWYAKTALRQQQENEQKKCGLKGPGWSSDLAAHISWCRGSPPEAWKKQAQLRDQQLATCAKR